MAFAVKDRVKEISSTTGTGSLTLGGAVTGYRSFNAALSNGDTTYYVIENPNTSEWETGLGTFTSPSTLARTTVLSSSTGSAVSFTAGAKNVFISLPATQFPAANTTVVGTDATQTLTNKSISGASNTVTNVSLTTGVTGTLPVANGGTGVTSSTGTGSVVLSASPTFTGTLAAAAGTFSSTLGVTGVTTHTGATTLSAALTYGGVTLSNSVTGTGSMVLSASPTLTGTVTAPKVRITNGSDYDLDGDANGMFMFDVANTRYPFKVNFGAYDNAIIVNNTGTVTFGSSISATTSISAGTTVNATTQYNVGGAIALSATSGNSGYTSIYDSSANIAGYIGGSSNAANYWQNTTHYFRDRPGSTVFASISSATLTSNVALTYGGVTLANSVTGTGSMVLSASPTFTGTGITVLPTGVSYNILLGSWGVSADYGFLSFSGSLSAASGVGIGGKGPADNNLYLQVPSGGKFKFYGAGSASGTEISSAGALTYGGVTLANSVTGTGSMVLSASPTFTSGVNLANNIALSWAGPSSGTYTINGNSGGGFAFTNNANGTGGPITFTSGSTEAFRATASLVTLNVALNYGGVTLSNSVTGTGSMVLSASPTFTGTLGVTGATSGTIGLVATAIAGSNTITFPAETGTARTTVSSGTVLQVVRYQTGAVATGTTIIPFDNSIPQNTEGTEFMTLAITPKSATSTLLVEVVCMVAHSYAGAMNLTAALFIDSTASSVATGVMTCGEQWAMFLPFSHSQTSGSTSSRTFKVRAGSNQAGTMTFNGNYSARIFGGVAASSITITEVVP